MSKRTHDPSYGKYRPAHITKNADDECVSHTQVYNYGYGSTVYQFVGPLASVKARQANVLYSYPPDPYMSSITKPTEIAPGLWHGTARHSNTSD